METNAMRILDTLGIRYEIRQYEVHPNDLGAEKVAAIGLPREQVFNLPPAPRQPATTARRDRRTAR